MQIADHPFRPDHIAAPPESARFTRAVLRRSDYRAWRDGEIVGLELSITRAVLARCQLLRVNRTIQIGDLLVANERHLLRLGSALAVLTSIPFVLGELLSSAACSAGVELDALA